MHDVMRKRVMRKLEALPESQLYQVLDYIEFLEQRYASVPSPSATGFQRFAERLEDQMRLRSLAAATMSGTMKAVSVASKVIDGISGVFEGPPAGGKSSSASGRAARPEPPSRPRRGAEESSRAAGERPALPRPAEPTGEGARQAGDVRVEPLSEGVEPGHEGVERGHDGGREPA